MKIFQYRILLTVFSWPQREQTERINTKVNWFVYRFTKIFSVNTGLYQDVQTTRNELLMIQLLDYYINVLLSEYCRTILIFYCNFILQTKSLFSHYTVSVILLYILMGKIYINHLQFNRNYSRQFNHSLLVCSMIFSIFNLIFII